MTKLKIINQEELKDWAKEIFQKNSLIWLMFHLRKKHFVEL